MWKSITQYGTHMILKIISSIYWENSFNWLSKFGKIIAVYFIKLITLYNSWMLQISKSPLIQKRLHTSAALSFKIRWSCHGTLPFSSHFDSFFNFSSQNEKIFEMTHDLYDCIDFPLMWKICNLPIIFISTSPLNIALLMALYNSFNIKEKINEYYRIFNNKIEISSMLIIYLWRFHNE